MRRLRQQQSGCGTLVHPKSVSFCAYHLKGTHNGAVECGKPLQEMHLQATTDFGSLQVGAIGFCMGGALTFLAAEYAAIDAAAPFYGTPPAELGHVWLCCLPHSNILPSCCCPWLMVQRYWSSFAHIMCAFLAARQNKGTCPGPRRGG